MTTFFDRRPPNAPFLSMLRHDPLRRSFRIRDATWAGALRAIPLRRGERVIDVGGSTGLMIDRIGALRGTKGVCVDIAMRGLIEARDASSALPVCADAAALPFADAAFAATLSFETLEHIRDVEAAVGELVRVTRPGGWIVVSAVSARWRYTWDWWLRAVGIDVLSRADHDPDLFVDPERLESAFTAAGASIRERHFLNSFATLAFDELVMGVALVLDRAPAPIGRVALEVLVAMRRMAGPMLWLADAPWRRARRSNSILVVAERTSHGVPR